MLNIRSDKRLETLYKDCNKKIFKTKKELGLFEVVFYFGENKYGYDAGYLNYCKINVPNFIRKIEIIDNKTEILDKNNYNEFIKSLNNLPKKLQELKINYNINIHNIYNFPQVFKILKISMTDSSLIYFPSSLNTLEIEYGKNIYLGHLCNSLKTIKIKKSKKAKNVLHKYKYKYKYYNINQY